MTDERFDSHGGGFSNDGKISFGYSSLRGLRISMEDCVYAKISEVHGQVVGLFGVFDGHAGPEAAKYVKQNLFANLIKHPKFVSDTHTAIEETFKQTDAEYLQAATDQNRDAGSTASTAVLVGNRLLVANVGDSRAVISRAGEAIALSNDHKPGRNDERKRIEEAGGVVLWEGTWRVGGVLAVSRAFGDRLLKRYVVADPEIQEEQINNDLDFLVIASDGLWDVIRNEDALSLVQSIVDPVEAARRLTETAFHKVQNSIMCWAPSSRRGQGYDEAKWSSLTNFLECIKHSLLNFKCVICYDSCFTVGNLKPSTTMYYLTVDVDFYNQVFKQKLEDLTLCHDERTI